MTIKLKLLGILVVAASLPLACDDDEDAQGAGGRSGAESQAGEGGEPSASGGSAPGGSGLGGSQGGGAGAIPGGESGASTNGGQGGAEAGAASHGGAPGEGGMAGGQSGAPSQGGAAGQGGADDGPMPNPRCDTASVSSLQGSGTQLDPYLFCLPEQLALFGTGSYRIDAAYALGRDLDASALTTSSLGGGSEVLAGSLDGGSHRISNMNASLLSEIAASAEVSNLRLSGQLAGGTARGLLATTNDGVVRDVHIEGVFSLSDHAGALLGYNTGIIERCSAAGTINGLNHVGGLIGQNEGAISLSWSDVDVTAGNRVGGLAGNLTSPGVIRESYALGSVSGTQSVGGLVGTLFGGEVKDSFARAPLITGPKAGGLIGAVGGNATLTRCYAASTLPADGRGLVGSATHAFTLTTSSSYFLDTATDTVGTALTAQAMQSEASFVGWDFIGVWSLEPAGASFPRLAFAD